MLLRTNATVDTVETTMSLLDCAAHGYYHGQLAPLCLGYDTTALPPRSRILVEWLTEIPRRELHLLPRPLFIPETRTRCELRHCRLDVVHSLRSPVSRKLLRPIRVLPQLVRAPRVQYRFRLVCSSPSSTPHPFGPTYVRERSTRSSLTHLYPGSLRLRTRLIECFACITACCRRSRTMKILYARSSGSGLSSFTARLERFSNSPKCRSGGSASHSGRNAQSRTPRSREARRGRSRLDKEWG